MQCYAGIDPSITNTGAVLLDENGALVGCVNSKFADRKQSDPIERYRWLALCVGTGLFDLVPSGGSIAMLGYEDYSFGSTHRAFSLAEFGGILKSKIYDIGCASLKLFAPMWNKKFATLDGSASKERMMSQAVEECPELSKLKKGELTSDVCDAYFLAKAAWYLCEPVETMAENETNKALLRHRLEMVKAWKEKNCA